ncbi:MAG: hypothetical protein DMG92_00965 [Acidobacteria bacterium]|nr:MAG: hypothetical protein DMG92_00965 [Acidobacteriota bacterium]
MAAPNENFRRLLRTVAMLSDLGPEMTAERDFAQTANVMLSALMHSTGAREGVLFVFIEKPAMLNSITTQGFALIPDPSVIPLLPRHVHALTSMQGAVLLAQSSYDTFLSANGNVAPELFRCVTPLKVAGKLVGAVALGRREADALYDEEGLQYLDLLCHYVALAVQNHALTQTLAQRVSDNLRLMASLHGFYDNTLEAFANAIDVKHVNIHGHSLRVGLFGKPTVLDAEEFREMADHTTVGHQIVTGVQFPWPFVPEVVRWHHERADGSGYPDGLLNEEIPMPARIVGLADTFDAMTSPRPYRERISLAATLSEIVRNTPQRFDPSTVQALLLQLRRDAVGSNRSPFLEGAAGQLAPTDIDHLAANLQHKTSNGRLYLT